MVIPIRDNLPTKSKPVLTIAIIVACLYIYGFVQPHSSDQEVQYLAQHAAIPCEVVHGKPISNQLSQQCDGQLRIPGLSPFSPTEPFPHKNVFLAIVVSMFLHGSWLHVLGNMLFLWIFGNNVEERMGPVGFAVFYLVAGFVAALTHIATQATSTVPVVGASGAIAGVMGAYLVLFPRARVLTIIPLFIFFPLIYLPAWLVLLGWLALQFFTNPNTGVAVAAHIGGFIFGAAVGLFLRGAARAAPPPGPPPPDWGFSGGPY